MTGQRMIGYIWASPVTAGALVIVFLGLVTGGRARIVEGVVEIHGGLVAWFLRRGMPWFGPAAAMTLGHVILGRDSECLERSRAHENVHVRQFERWGALMVPLYLGASGWCWLRGFDAYLDNPFEREAYGEDEK
jgi:hypothetical protein